MSTWCCFGAKRPGFSELFVFVRTVHLWYCFWVAGQALLLALRCDAGHVHSVRVEKATASKSSSPAFFMDYFHTAAVITSGLGLER